MQRTVLAIALLAVAVSAGCTGLADRGGHEPPDGTTTAVGVTETTTAETTETTTAGTTETRTSVTATTALVTTSDEPEKGDQFLSTMALDESQAMEWNASKRAAFGNLSADRQRVVKQAVECDCSVELDGEFDFGNKERVEVVNYDGTYYFLRVVIV